MKVSKKGNPNGWKVKRICGNEPGGIGCGEKVEVSEENIFLFISYDMCGAEINRYYSFECPNCQERTHISVKRIPKAIREKVFEKYKNGIR